MKLSTRTRKLRQYLFEPVDAASSVFYRMAFGLSLFLFALYHVELDFMEQYFVETEFNFTYYGLNWVEPLPASWMYLLLVLLGLSGILIALGWRYRLATASSGLILTYFLVSEPAYYQNHVYLLILLSFLGVFLPLNSTNAIDNPCRNDRDSDTVPRLVLYLLRFQIGIVYVYAGFAKTNYDWFNCQPLMPELNHHADIAFLGPLFNEPWVVIAAAYGVLVLEYSIVPLLLWDKTRWGAFVLVTSFHFTNATIWGIDVFPWFMIAATTVFLPANWPRKVGLMGLQKTGENTSRDFSITQQNLIVLATILYLTWQLLFPFRHLFYRGHVGWNEWGRDFAWRMKLDGKSANEIVYVLHYPDGKIHLVKARKHLTSSQYVKLERRPIFVYQYAQFLAKRYRDDFIYPEVRVNFKVAFNGRPPQYMVDPSVNLRNATVSWGTPDWIVPLKNTIKEENSCL